MAPRTRTKNGKNARLQRQSTQFGELDTTPTSHALGPLKDEPLLSKNNVSGTEASKATGLLDEILGESDTMDIGQPAQAKPFSWSDDDSLGSSPVRLGDTPKSIWQFNDEDSLSPLSSLKKSKDSFTDILHPSAELQGVNGSGFQKHGIVDFSETASTIRRSSPFGFGDADKDIWDFQKSPSSLSVNEAFSSIDVEDGKLPDTMPISMADLAVNLPTMELDGTIPDSKGRPLQNEAGSVAMPASSGSNLVNRHLNGKKATPKGDLSDTAMREIRLDKAQAKAPRGSDTGLLSSSIDSGKEKRPKQRAKTPIQFDAVTQEIKAPTDKKKPSPKGSIVAALRDSVKTSSSPAVVSRKRPAPKSTQARKRAKTAAPEKKEPQSTPITVQGRGSQGRQQSLTSPKSPKQRVLEASQQNKQGPPSGKGTIEIINIEEESALVIISSDEEDGLTFKDPPRPTQPLPKPSLQRKVEDELSTDGPLTERTGFEGGERVTEPKKSMGLNGFMEEKAVVKITSGVNSDATKAQPPVGDLGNGRRIAHMDSFGATSVRRDLNELRVEAVEVVEKVDCGPSHGGKPDRAELGMRQSQCNPRGRRISRQFSVSERGSPVRTEWVGRVQTVLHEVDRSGSVETDLPNRVDHTPLGMSGMAAPTLESPKNPSKTSRNGYGANSDSSTFCNAFQDDNDLSTSRPVKVAPSSDQTVGKGRRNIVTDELRAQVLASITAEFAGMSDERKRDNGLQPQKGAAVMGEESKAGRNISKHLYYVIDRLTAQLTDKEASVYRVADAYRDSGMQCIERIQNRCMKEKNNMREACRRDEVRFEKAIRTARDAVATNTKEHETSVGALADHLAERRVKYEWTSSRLRALHGQLMNGQRMRIGEEMCM